MADKKTYTERLKDIIESLRGFSGNHASSIVLSLEALQDHIISVEDVVSKDDLSDEEHNNVKETYNEVVRFYGNKFAPFFDNALNDLDSDSDIRKKLISVNQELRNILTELKHKILDHMITNHYLEGKKSEQFKCIDQALAIVRDEKFLDSNAKIVEVNGKSVKNGLDQLCAIREEIEKSLKALNNFSDQDVDRLVRKNKHICADAIEISGFVRRYESQPEVQLPGALEIFGDWYKEGLDERHKETFLKLKLALESLGDDMLRAPDSEVSFDAVQRGRDLLDAYLNEVKQEVDSMHIEKNLEGEEWAKIAPLLQAKQGLEGMLGVLDKELKNRPSLSLNGKLDDANKAPTPSFFQPYQVYVKPANENQNDDTTDNEDMFSDAGSDDLTDEYLDDENAAVKKDKSCIGFDAGFPRH